MTAEHSARMGHAAVDFGAPTAAMVAAFSAANGIDMTLAANLMSDLCIPPEPAGKTAADELHWGEGGAVRVSAEAAPAALTTN